MLAPIDCYFWHTTEWHTICGVRQLNALLRLAEQQYGVYFAETNSLHYC